MILLRLGTESFWDLRVTYSHAHQSSEQFYGRTERRKNITRQKKPKQTRHHCVIYCIIDICEVVSRTQDRSWRCQE